MAFLPISDQTSHPEEQGTQTGKSMPESREVEPPDWPAWGREGSVMGFGALVEARGYGDLPGPHSVGMSAFYDSRVRTSFTIGSKEPGDT